MTSEQDFQQRFDHLIDAIEVALSNIQGGQVPVLGDLELQAARLCDDIMSAPGEHARSMQPMLGDLIARMDELVETLSDFKHAMESSRKE